MSKVKLNEKKFQIHLSGYGGEIVLGRITKSQYEFWRGNTDLEEHAQSWSDEDNELNIPEDMQLFTDGMWYDRDDLEHEYGCEFAKSCLVTVYDESNKEVFCSTLDYDTLSTKGVVIEGIAKIKYRVSNESDAKYFFFGQSFEYGTFQTYEIIDKEFDPVKLSFCVSDIEGWALITGVSYMSKELENTGEGSTTGKGSTFEVLAVEST